MWQDILGACDLPFSPNLLLLHAQTLQVLLKTTGKYELGDLWTLVDRALFFSSEASSCPKTSVDLLVRALDAFDAAVAAAEAPLSKQKSSHWSTSQYNDETRFGRSNTFLGLSAQFAILAYIRYKAQKDPTRLRHRVAKNEVGLLENAMFGHENYLGYGSSILRAKIPHKRRLDTVRFLLDVGVLDCHSSGDVARLQSEARHHHSKAEGEDTRQYYVTIIEDLKSRDIRGIKGTIKSMSTRLRSMFGDKS
jgi:hypothetical protein